MPLPASSTAPSGDIHPVDKLFKDLPPPEIAGQWRTASPGDHVTMILRPSGPFITNTGDAVKNILDTFVRDAARIPISDDPDCLRLAVIAEHSAHGPQFLEKLGLFAIDWGFTPWATGPDYEKLSNEEQYYHYAAWVARGRRDDEDPSKLAPATVRKSEDYACLPESTDCRVCGTATATRCSGCAGALRSGIGKCFTSYCSKKCQKADWPTHKTACRLVRAVSILLPLFVLIESYTFRHPNTFVHKEHGIMRIHPCDAYPPVVRAFIGASIVPADPSDSLIDDMSNCPKLLNALVLNNGSTEVITTYLPLVKYLLEPVSPMLKLNEVWCEPKNCAMPTYLREDDASGSLKAWNHAVVVVRTPGNEAFALDMTAAQYGWDDVLARLDVYKRCRVDQIEQEEPLGASLSKPSWRTPVHNSENDPAVPVDQMRHNAQDCVVDGVRAVLQRHNLCLQDLLGGSVRDFESRRAEVLGAAQDALKVWREDILLKGTYRMCYDDSGRFRIVGNTPSASFYKQVWLTEDEMESCQGNLEKMRDTWLRKMCLAKMT